MIVERHAWDINRPMQNQLNINDVLWELRPISSLGHELVGSNWRLTCLMWGLIEQCHLCNDNLKWWCWQVKRIEQHKHITTREWVASDAWHDLPTWPSLLAMMWLIVLLTLWLTTLTNMAALKSALSCWSLVGDDWQLSLDLLDDFETWCHPENHEHSDQIAYSIRSCPQEVGVRTQTLLLDETWGGLAS